jgi:hypothetical protein
MLSLRIFLTVTADYMGHSAKIRNFHSPAIIATMSYVIMRDVIKGYDSLTSKRIDKTSHQNKG